MARVLLVPIALLGVAASLAFLGCDFFAAGQAWVAHVPGPRAAGSVGTAVIVAALVTAVSVPVGLLFALGLRGGGAIARAAALACCALLLLVPRLGISALPAAAGDADSFRLMGAMAQATAVVTLFLAVSGGPLPAGLIVAARAAGARRMQAWRHATLAPLAWPLWGAAAAAFVMGLRDGPLDFAPPDDLAVFRFCGAIAALLLALVSLAMLGAAGRSGRSGSLLERKGRK